MDHLIITESWGCHARLLNSSQSISLEKAGKTWIINTVYWSGLAHNWNIYWVLIWAGCFCLAQLSGELPGNFFFFYFLAEHFIRKSWQNLDNQHRLLIWSGISETFIGFLSELDVFALPNWGGNYRVIGGVAALLRIELPTVTANGCEKMRIWGNIQIQNIYKYKIHTNTNRKM